MTTFPPILPRPILSKPTTNNVQSSMPIFLIQSSTVTNSDLNINNSSQVSSFPSIPLSAYEEFLKRLRDFHRGRQTTFRSLPTIAGKTVDLHLLYNTVISYGGWDKVTDRQLWSTVADKFSIDSACLNGTQALKNIYIRYLYAFEKINNGENIDSHDDENEESKRRTVSQLQRVPQTYNHLQHNVADAARVQYGLFNDFVHRNEFEKLELALICGFPNELTFTLNTLLLLSSSSNHSKSFHLYKCPRLLDLLLRHSGLFLSSDSINNDYNLKVLYDNIWSKHINYHMDTFLIESCSPSIVKLLLNIDNDNTNRDLYKYFNFNFNNNQQQQQFRIEQILMIIRNLSFDRLNAIYLLDAIQLTLSLTYKFLLLISYCEKHIELQKYAYDIWTNLALYMHIRTISNDEGLLFRQLLHDMLNGDDSQQQDRLKIIRALEIIANLAHAGNDNGTYLIEYVHIMIKSLIHTPDILVLVHTLECLYQLSELGEQICNAIIEVQSSRSIIATLIDLLTIEARSFSSQTIKTIKIVEMSTGPLLLPSYQQPPMSSQMVVGLSTNQLPQQHPTYTIENPDLNRTSGKLIVQQYSKPLSINDVIPSDKLSSNPIQIQLNNEKKRKHDSILETIMTGGSCTSSPFKRSFPLKGPIIISSSTENENAKSIQSTISDLLDRSTSSSSLENDIRLCLNDLCQRVELIIDQSFAEIYNKTPSPTFKRKMIKEGDQIEEPTQNKKPTQLLRKTSVTDNDSNGIFMTEKIEESNEPESHHNKLTMPTQNAITTSSSTNPLDYICQWENCQASFSTARSAFQHACSVHVKNLSDYVCLWNGCDRLKRQKWALISHIQERHCSETAFRQAKLKLANGIPPSIGHTPAITINSNRSLISGTNCYVSDAAWHAIRRHMQINSFDEQINKNKEGPLTKNIRLTAALILRNIARHSLNGKQSLRQHEQLIANLAVEASEASHTLSACLFELYN